MSAIPTAYLLTQLLFGKTFAQPVVFVVVKCTDVAMSVFYFLVLTRCRIYLQLWTALS